MAGARRTGQRRLGCWGGDFDLDVPDAIAGYAENQRFVGVYVLATVNDPSSDFPDKKAPVYLTLLAPYKDGLPYDYSQVRVFGWSAKRHRYETSYREHDLWGYLPAGDWEADFS